MTEVIGSLGVANLVALPWRPRADKHTKEAWGDYLNAKITQNVLIDRIIERVIAEHKKP